MNQTTQLQQVQVYESNMTALLQRLKEIQSERKKKCSDLDGNFSLLISLLDQYQQHLEAVLLVSEQPSIDRKKLCLKFKDLSIGFLMKVSNYKICWKFLSIAAAKFDSILQREFKFILDSFFYYGETELGEYYKSRVVLLTSIVKQVLNYLPSCIICEQNDILRLPDEAPELKEMNDWIVRVQPTDAKKLNSKYISLGEKFKALKVSFQKAEGSFIGMAMKFPYYFVFKSITDSEANLFLSDPKAETLSKVWNCPGAFPVLKECLNLITTSVKTRRDIYFEKLFPTFSFEDIRSGAYRETLDACLPRCTEQLQAWNPFTPRKEGGGVLRATVLSDVAIVGSALPLQAKASHTVIFYAGGGGFVANIQPVQENFLKRWANNTSCTIIQLHYSLSPEFKYPTQQNDLFNLYTQILLYYKTVMRVPQLRVVLMGDSAGGSVALSLMAILAKLDFELPQEAMLIYPAADLRPNRFSPSFLHSFDDRLLYFSVALSCFKAYVPEGLCTDEDWVLSPAIAPDEVLLNFPPMTIFIGELDSLRDDCAKLAYKLHKLGKVKSRLVEIEGLYHGFLGFKLPLYLGVDEISQVHDLVQRCIIEGIKS